MSGRRALGVELVVITLIITGAVVVRHHLPSRIALGDGLLCAAAVLLAQGLARDLARVYAARRERLGNPDAPPRVTCFCVESTVGLTSIVVGMALTLGWAPIRFSIPQVAWPIGLGAVLLFGTGVRNAVFDWRQRRVRMEPNHAARVVWRS